MTKVEQSLGGTMAHQRSVLNTSRGSDQCSFNVDPRCSTALRSAAHLHQNDERYLDFSLDTINQAYRLLTKTHDSHCLQYDLVFKDFSVLEMLIACV